MTFREKCIGAAVMISLNLAIWTPIALAGYWAYSLWTDHQMTERVEVASGKALDAAERFSWPEEN